MYQRKSNSKHSLAANIPHPGGSTIEIILEQHLFQISAQIAELKMSLSLCESKLSQLADEFVEIKSSQSLSGSHFNPECWISPTPIAPDINDTSPNQLDLLSSVNATGVSAQLKRGHKASVI